jgi:hypothetical protein
MADADTLKRGENSRFSRARGRAPRTERLRESLLSPLEGGLQGVLAPHRSQRAPLSPAAQNAAENEAQSRAAGHGG